MKIEKIISAIIVDLLLFTQLLLMRLMWRFEITPDLLAPIIKQISVSNNELSPTNPVKVLAVSDELSGFNKGIITYIKPNSQQH